MASTLITQFGHLQIPLQDVAKATGNFADANINGHSGFGPAYKGQLDRSGNSIKITAMRYLIRYAERDLDFFKEISMLSDLKHTNLVSLVGFCDENHEKIIVITREANGSLVQYLNNPNLTWTQRLSISVGVARALRYLHHDFGRREYGVIHRNINSSTILLHENWEAKLSSFMVSVKQPVKLIEEAVFCEPVGTNGYVDPAVISSGGVSVKSDIYSFGVVLFEMLCGRTAYVKEMANGFLAPLAKQHFVNGTLKDIAQNQVWNQILSPESLIKYSEIAYSCIEEEPRNRPGIKHVVGQLEEALKLQQLRENLISNLKHLKIRLSDIKVATNDFSEKYIIGSSKYLTFYRAELEHFDIENSLSVEGENKGEYLKRHNTVTIKRINHRRDENYFYNSIGMLSSVKHHNIVALLGFCVDGLEMILVTENFCNDYLDYYLGNVNNMRALTWENRLKICIDVAHSLNYLHSMMEDQKMIVNSCINRYNIWLDENWGAKIVEFGLSKFLPPNEKDEGICFESRDPDSYLDPKYEETGKLQRESDVYSFGVVLMEILCGKKANDPIYLKKTDKGIAHVARQLLYWETLEKMIDPTIKENTSANNLVLNRGANRDSLNTFIEIAYKCVEESKNERPTMVVVVKQLEKALYFQIRNQPEPVFQRILLKMIPIIDAWLISCFSCESTIQEECVPCSNTNQDVDKLVDALEVWVTQEIPRKNLEHLKIRLTDIEIATKGFSHEFKIAYRNSYTCYRAELGHFDNQIFSSVVIKQISSGEHFVKEIDILTGVKHPNITNVFGFCVEDSHMLLVTDNVCNGYLVDYLTNNNKRRILTWEKRLKICIDVASALNYLHSEMEDQKIIIHGDICSYNIGLDENWGAKIVCFKDSVFLHPNQEDDAISVNGNIGRPFYKDPEYEKSGKLNKKSDVYSFGVLLFEILCGTFANNPTYTKESSIGLADVARRNFHAGTLWYMIDPILKEETSKYKFNLIRGPNKDSLQTFTQIATQCVAETQDYRPTMKEVVMLLKKALLFHESKDNHKISLEDVKGATKNLSEGNLIGRGGFSNVYKGTLQNGSMIVAKQLIKGSAQEVHEFEFVNELRILSEYEHENIIGLVGYCNEQEEKIIIFEYASNGSLHRHLEKDSLTWVRRLNICIDVASALYYLHGGFGRRAKVIHRDIKVANILLNNDWKAKLADFGLSFVSPITQETDYVIDHWCGTPGYVDPLYQESGYLTMESDIYSFGVVLFEILCGRFAMCEHHKVHRLLDFVKSSFKDGKHDEVLFVKIREQIEPRSLTTFQNIAYQCLHHKRENRPTIKEVLAELIKASVFQASTQFTHLQIPLEDIVNATNNFHDDNFIKLDGFSTTFKGQLLWSGRSMKIAARRFDSTVGEGELRFLTEISVLSDLKHTNLASIIGFCDEKNEKIILTTYVANGSLKSYLKNPKLTWTQRLKICLGVARSLSYLHYDEGRDYAIIHCNITSDAILLDENWEAKLSGFEICIKQSGVYNDKVWLCEHAGTMGCMDPAIGKTGGVTRKSDIYSFGMLLNETLPYRVPDVAHSCLNEDPDRRPSMNQVVDELEKELKLQLPIINIENNLEHLRIRLTDIKFATEDFSATCMIFDSRYYSCYRAELKHFNKQNPSSVVIKRINPGYKAYQEQHFVSEFEVLTRVKHPNIVSIFGFCNEDSEMIIVSEDVSNGHLVRYLKGYKDMSVLTWETRLKICIDVAHVLNYFHYEMEDQMMIIHRDICSENIGLDENWRAKIVGFEASVFLPINHESEAIKRRDRSTYTDLRGRKWKRESDVYSFGVVLFEIFCGRSSDDWIYLKKYKKGGLAPAVRVSFRQGTLEEMIDPVIKDELNETSLHTFINIAIRCLAIKEGKRPTMKVVLEELEKALVFQMNP